jgi:glycosyltransferase involved in cell wall biosynthesis
LTFHLLALPNTQTTRAYSLDGFSQVTIRFARILKDLDHKVFLYASEENEAPCDELITVIKKEEIATLLGVNDTPYMYAYIEAWSPIWQLANARMIKEIAKRKQPRDFICTIGGGSQEPVAKAHPDLMCVEYSIGYQGSFSPYRVFESRIWRHHTYAAQGITDGRFFDTVIPCFFDPAEFRFNAQKEGFVLYVGRLIPRKGIGIACRAAKEAGVPLKIIGHGDKSLVTHGAEYIGALDMAERNEWMSRASAVLCPTQYIEPFCCVAVEAMMCGTAVISTDFGGFVETVEHGKTGFRCSYLGEFVRAIRDCTKLTPAYIWNRAVQNYSMQAVAPQYEAYFRRLSLLWDGGWDSLESLDSSCKSAEQVKAPQYAE